MDMNIWYNIEINFECLSDNVYSVSLGNHVRYLSICPLFYHIQYGTEIIQAILPRMCFLFSSSSSSLILSNCSLVISLGYALLIFFTACFSFYYTTFLKNCKDTKQALRHKLLNTYQNDNRARKDKKYKDIISNLTKDAHYFIRLKAQKLLS